MLAELGIKIRRLRKRRGLTISGLAKLSGIPAGTIGWIERGEGPTTITTLHALCKALDVNPGDLFPSTNTKPLIHCRGEAGISKETSRRAEEVMALYDELEDASGAWKGRSFPLDFPVRGMEPKDIEDAALLARELLGVRHGLVYDLVSMLEISGLRVIVMTLPPETWGFSYCALPRRAATFFLNDAGTTERGVFTLAHELGHVILHQGFYGASASFSGTDKELDKAASWFAACFLMPERAVRAVIDLLGVAPDDWTWDVLMSVKRRFAVSAQTFLYRLDELSIINSRAFKTLDAKLKEHYKNTGNMEPAPAPSFENQNRRLWDLVNILSNRPGKENRVKKIARRLTELGIWGIEK